MAVKSNLSNLYNLSNNLSINLSVTLPHRRHGAVDEQASHHAHREEARGVPAQLLSVRDEHE